MPGPAKTNPANTTTIRLKKSKTSRAVRVVPLVPPLTGISQLDRHLADLNPQIDDILQRLGTIEQKLNRMNADPTTHVVTFVA